MTDQRSAGADEFDDVMALLREAALDWVVEEIQTEIDVGEIEAREITPREARLANVDIRGTSGPSVLVDRRPYSQAGRLAIATSAIRQVVVEVARMEDVIRTELGSDVFMASDDSEAPQALVRRERPGSIERLEVLLNGLEAGE